MSRIAIVGGGIAGLATAIYLRCRGLDVTVYERTPTFAPVGAGILLSPNAIEVLDRVGLAQDAVAAGVSLEEFMVSDVSLRPYQRLSAEWCRTHFKHGLVTLRRSDLHAVLAAGLEDGVVRLGKELTSLTAKPEGVRLDFADGSTETADQVLGADGLRSRVRSSLFGEVPLRYAGQTTFRALVPFELSAPWARKGLEIWGGPFRFGFSSTKPDEVYYFCVFEAPPGTSHPPEEARGLMLDGLRDFPGIVRELVEATPSDALLQTDLDDFEPLPRWSNGPVGLIGDAAHATTPNLGQGGAQALEDAYHVDACVDVETGRVDLERFYRRRRVKTARITNQSYLFGRLAHATRLTGLRDFVLRATPTWVTLRQTRRIYTL